MVYLAVKFFNTLQSYTYMCDIDNVKVGDTVVVDSPNTGLTCAEVVRVDYTDPTNKATKYIVDIVDTTKYKAMVEADRRKKELMSKMKKLYKDNSEIAMFELMSQQNPEMSKLLKEYKSIEVQ